MVNGKYWLTYEDYGYREGESLQLTTIWVELKVDNLKEAITTAKDEYKKVLSRVSVIKFNDDVCPTNPKLRYELSLKIS